MVFYSENKKTVKISKYIVGGKLITYSAVYICLNDTFNDYPMITFPSEYEDSRAKLNEQCANAR